ncbi:hypothetical protein V8Z74_11725 [Comamonas sp. w2-DMI]|uniref:hypothetical protein n=1 Tax=Comamonas sp. w2-DMI TaxID=3126391 RepID=UPI0032E491E9
MAGIVGGAGKACPPGGYGPRREHGLHQLCFCQLLTQALAPAIACKRKSMNIRFFFIRFTRKTTP